MQPDRDSSDPSSRGQRRDDVALVCNYWSLRILDLLASGQCQYEYFQKELSIARNVLASRLAGLRSLGLIDRKQCKNDQRCFFYRLTTRGREFLPVIAALRSWPGWDGAREGQPGITKLGKTGSESASGLHNVGDFHADTHNGIRVSSD